MYGIILEKWKKYCYVQKYHDPSERKSEKKKMNTKFLYPRGNSDGCSNVCYTSMGKKKNVVRGIRRLQVDSRRFPLSYTHKILICQKEA